MNSLPLPPPCFLGQLIQRKSTLNGGDDGFAATLFSLLPGRCYYCSTAYVPAEPTGGLQVLPHSTSQAASIVLSDFTSGMK